MRLTKFIYIASAYTHKSEDIMVERFLNITQCIGKLQDKFEYAFFGPITQSHLTAQFMKKTSTKFKDWALIDLTVLSKCDELWIYMDLQEAYKQSTGVQAEFTFAISNNIPVRFIHPTTYKVKKMKYLETI